MFVQIIQGEAADREVLRTAMQRWVDELMPSAQGFLGSTGGITDDGTFLTMARFESEEAARRNSDRPEQGAWWKDTAAAFDGEVTFHDSTDVDVVLGGGDDDAGFVQVIQGRAGDRSGLEALERRMLDRIREARPELIGWVRAWYGDSEFTQFVYFTSEAEARAKEAEPPPPEAEAAMAEMGDVLGDVRYFDLREPVLVSP